jgi:hypothetical protein
MKPFSRLAFLALLVLGYPLMVWGYDVSFASTMVSVAECDVAATVSVVRVSSGEGASWVDVRTVPGSAKPHRDYVATTGRVSFAAGQEIANAVIQLLPDTVPEPAKTLQLVLETCSNCIPGVVPQCTVRIQDGQTAETLAQDFSSALPLGWCITTNSSAKGYWRFDDPLGRGNHTGGSGIMAIADSDFRDCMMNSELMTAPFAVATTSLTYLVFKTDYVFCTYDIADVDLSLSGREGPWTNLWRRQGADYPGPVTEIIDLTPLARGQSNVMVRFHYYNADYDYYWQVDDVALLVEPDANTNNIPDWWEMAFYGGTTNLSPGLDSDEDGAFDVAEYLAGTDPKDPWSRLEVKGLSGSEWNYTLRFQAVTGYYYSVKGCANLADPSWSTRASRIEGLGGTIVVDFPESGQAEFYRLDVSRW